MGDRHGGRFARRGRALSPPRRNFPTARCGFPMARGGGQDLPRAETLPSANASRNGARAKGFAPRRNTPHGEGLPTRRTGERICPAREYSPRRRPPDTALGRKELPRAEMLPTAKASRHGAQAKGVAPRGSRSPHVPTNGGPLPTDEQPEKHPFGGVAPDTAHGRKDLPAQERSLGEGLSTRHTSERICPAQKHAPRRKPPDTAHRRKDLPRAETLSSAKTYRHGARAKEFARAGTRPSAKASRHGARAKGFAPRGSRSPQVPTNGGPPPTDGQPEKHPFGGVAPETARPLPSSFTEKK